MTNDQYFSLVFNETAKNWFPDSVIYIAYNATAGLITDLAGNLMPPSGFGSPSVFPSPPLIPNNFVLNPYENFNGENGKIFSTDKFPPFILTTLGAVGGTRLYMKFNEPVLDDSTSPTAITASNFSLSWGASINDIEIISSENIRGANAATEIYLNLGSPISIENIFDGNINVSAINNIRDMALNPYDTSIAHETSDVLLGVIEPVWAMNSILGGNSSVYTIRNFDGSEYLLNADITIESVILSNVAQYTSLPVKLYYDVNVAESKRFDSGFWSVFSIPGLIDDVNVSARNARQLADDGRITRDLIPGDDGEIQPGVTLEFLYSIGGKMTASIDNPNNLFSIRPWSLDIEQLLEQRGNTTVANNVINPENGDSAVIHYELERAGTVIISIFTVDNCCSDLVRILQRSRAGEGQHSIAWDGTNAGNTIVAPGFYFIRVVAPGIDETRKVLVVKP